MNKKQNITIAIIALLGIAVISTTAWAKKPVFIDECPAGLTGTWIGGAATQIRWFATHTSDSLDPTKGQMIMNWTYIKPYFIGGSESGFTLTPGHGVWQLNDDGGYDYTWYAYAISTDASKTGIIAGDIAGTIRVSGVAMLNINCDTAAIYYVFDIANGEYLPWDSNTVTFEYFTHGDNAFEVRVPLEVTPLPLE